MVKVLFSDDDVDAIKSAVKETEYGSSTAVNMLHHIAWQIAEASDKAAKAAK